MENNELQRWSANRFRFGLKLLLLMIVPIATFFAGRASLRIVPERKVVRGNAPNLMVPVIGEFEKAPLRTVVEDFSWQSNLPVQWDKHGLTSQGHSLDERVSFHLDSHISVKSALHLVLNPLGLSYYVNNGAIVITTEELADARRAEGTALRRCGVP